MTREEILGQYEVTPSATSPGWYEVTAPPVFDGEDRHLVALVDSEIGAVTTVLGCELVQAIIVARTPEAENAVRLRIEAFGTALH